MANTYKNIVITPNIGSAVDDPKIVFSGGNATVNTDITLRTYPTSNGTLSFEGSAGQLFSITNNLTGTLFSVNDISGIPSIEVLDNGDVKLAQYSGNVLVGTGTDNNIDKLQVVGSANVTTLSIQGYGTVVAANGAWVGLASGSGFSGRSGYSGFSGYSGTNGSNGATGTSGFSGTNGSNGATGTSGFSGFSGVSGYSGISGYSGRSGFSGTNGSNGATGTSGFSGTNGSNGATGTSGFSGFSGVSGYSGISGYSGSAGPSTTINATDDAATTTLYPVMAGAAGSNQTAKVTTSKLIYNASTGTLSTTNFNSSSDQTLKINTKTLVDGLKTVIQLNPVSFNWRDTGRKGYGVIAQEIENVIPEIVETNGTIKSVSYDQIIPFLIQAVKELKIEIEELKSRM